MNIIYIILLFIAPGLIQKAIKEYITVSGSKSSKGTTYEQLFNVVVHSIVISFFVLIIINVIYAVLDYKAILSIKTLFAKLDNVGFIFFYTTVMAATTLLWMKVFNKYLYPEIIKKANEVTVKKYGATLITEQQRTVLQDMLYVDTRNLENPAERPPMIVAIYKDGQLVTAGELKEWNSSVEDPMEWKIHLTYEIGKVLEMDKNKEDAEKWLNYVEYEYFNFEYGILVKFYDPSRVREHWGELMRIIY